MNESTAHPSDSLEQRSLEEWALTEASSRLGVQLRKRRIALGDGATVEIDGMDEGGTVACEVYAHVGTLRGGQPKKLATDLLKLVVLRADQEQPGRRPIRLVLVVVDEPAERTLTSVKSWLGSAVRRFGVEVLRLDLPHDRREILIAAQNRQYR